MKDRELEDVMFAFVNNEFDVIVCTTIVETGLDIADANTIIINDANKFGLSQLYQLRGRVGRSDVQAYAYLLYRPDGEMSDTARERLKAIRELTKLGSGYQIAMRDMEIRGVGNVFGAEQHGHMLSVGFDLYCKILSDTIEEMKGNIEADNLEKNTVVDIKINAYFPENWISDKKQRMNEYKRLSICKDQNNLDNLVNEWQDRFGLIPHEASNLIEICRLKILANQHGVSSITQEGDLIRINTNLRLQTWLPVQRKLSSFLQSRLSFKSGAVGALNSSGIISFKISGIEAENIIETLKEIIIAK
jgi:transcription-repair coupling factor (superfamily II helicase)